MKFTNNTGQTKAVKVSSGHEILRPKESKNIKGYFDPDYIAYLEKQGVVASGSKQRTAKPKKAPKKASEKTQEATDEVTEADDDAPVVVTDEITDANAEIEGASE